MTSPRSILVFSGRYHIISTAPIVNNCIILYGCVIVMLSMLNTPDRRQSKTLMQLTGADQNSFLKV